MVEFMIALATGSLRLREDVRNVLKLSSLESKLPNLTSPPSNIHTKYINYIYDLPSCHTQPYIDILLTRLQINTHSYHRDTSFIAYLPFKL